jgi:tetratricopeptide (TPR) repeat protein
VLISVSATATAPYAPTTRIEGELLRIRGLLERGRFAEALGAAQALSHDVPEDRDVLYSMAVSQRYLNQIPDALATLARLEALHPRYSRLHQERGHCYVAARNPGAAVEAYLTAVNINAALPASWRALEVLFRSAGRSADATNAAAHVAKLASLAPSVVTATGLFTDGEVSAAEQLIREYLRVHPRDIEAMRLLAKIGMKLDVLDDAELLLEGLLALAPDYHAARYDYAMVLSRRHKHARALEELDRLLKIDPAGRAYRITDHWRAVLPATTLLEIPYEALIDDQEGWTRRMLDFVGLPWDARCLDFHRTDRVVITTSKWQVRQKLNAASVGRWRNYRKFLGPLRGLMK